MHNADISCLSIVLLQSKYCLLTKSKFKLGQGLSLDGSCFLDAHAEKIETDSQIVHPRVGRYVDTQGLVGLLRHQDG